MFDDPEFIQTLVGGGAGGITAGALIKYFFYKWTESKKEAAKLDKENIELKSRVTDLKKDNKEIQQQKFEKDLNSLGEKIRSLSLTIERSHNLAIEANTKVEQAFTKLEILKMEVKTQNINLEEKVKYQVQKKFLEETSK